MGAPYRILLLLTYLVRLGSCLSHPSFWLFSLSRAASLLSPRATSSTTKLERWPSTRRSDRGQGRGRRGRRRRGGRLSVRRWEEGEGASFGEEHLSVAWPFFDIY